MTLTNPRLLETIKKLRVWIKNSTSKKTPEQLLHIGKQIPANKSANKYKKLIVLFHATETSV